MPLSSAKGLYSFKADIRRPVPSAKEYKHSIRTWTYSHKSQSQFKSNCQQIQSLQAPVERWGRGLRSGGHRCRELGVDHYTHTQTYTHTHTHTGIHIHAHIQTLFCCTVSEKSIHISHKDIFTGTQNPFSVFLGKVNTHAVVTPSPSPFYSHTKPTHTQTLYWQSLINSFYIKISFITQISRH